jgi:two-component system chemotaxis response regulator CheB
MTVTGANHNDGVRVMIVGQSEAVSGMAARALEGCPGMIVAAKPVSGNLAIARLKREPVDVMVMEIDQKTGDPEKILGKILAADPGLKIILAGIISFSSVQNSMKGLLAGAAEFIPLPPPPRRKLRLRVDAAFQRDLRRLILALGHARQKEGQRQEAKLKPLPVILRKAAQVRPGVILIGSSTGGPKILVSIFRRLPLVVKQPILVVQHMPADFTKTLAETISKKTPWTCQEGIEGEEITGGRIYLAPGGIHMTVEGPGAKKKIRLDDGAKVNFCRPSADPLFASAAKAYGGKALCVVLTGMGRDGSDGARAIIDAGGTVIAQDENSSAVWGMPGAVAEGGLCSAVLPGRDIAPHIRKLATQ